MIFYDDKKQASTRIFYIVVFAFVIVLTFVVIALKEIRDKMNPEKQKENVQVQSVYLLDTSYVPPVYDDKGMALSFGNGILQSEDLIKKGKYEEAKKILFILSLYYPDSILVKKMQDENNAKMKMKKAQVRCCE